MPTKHNLTYVKQVFANDGCTLLATEYKNNQTKMPYICNCGRTSEIRFVNFQGGRRCSDCGGNKKHNLTYVKQVFANEGCTLLATEYKNNQTKMPYICNCGRTSEIRFVNFQGGRRCSDCGGNKKHNLTYVKQVFANEGCTLLATEYKNARTKMPYICNCGRTSEISFDSFKQGNRCQECYNERRGLSRRHNLTYVKQFFANGGCTLLATEYKNNETKMPYICNCGKKTEISFAKFRQGQRCSDCGIIKNSCWADADEDIGSFEDLFRGL